jgi:signal peptidase I
MTLFSVRYCEWCGKQKEPINTCRCEVKIESIPTREDDKMSGQKIHVLPDENLGGGPNGQILREYVEVDRRPRVGEFVVTPDGSIRMAVNVNYNYTFVDGPYNAFRNEELKTLEPTDIVHIDDTRYRLVDRKAKVGDRIIIVDGKGWYRDKVGNIYEVIHSSKYGFEEDDDGRAYVEYEKNEYDEAIHYVRRENYRVLEPVEPAENELVTAEEGDDKSVLDLLANLARRVTELEQKLNFVKSDVNMILDDIVTLDERTQPLAAVLSALAKAVKADE